MVESTDTFNIEVKTENDVRLVTIQGTLADDATVRAKEAFLLLIDEKPKKVVVDLTRMDYISSAGIGLFVSAMRRCKQREISMSLFGLVDEIAELFKMTHLDQVFKIFEDKAAAFAAE